jgi:intraflagellar transport protein 46
MALSKKDQTLLRGPDLSDAADIAPHSRFDQSITFDDDGSDPGPGAFWPRPDPDEAPPNFAPLGGAQFTGDGLNGLSNFELKFPDAGARLPFGQTGGYSSGFAPFDPPGGGPHEFSPRPSGPSPATRPLASRAPASSPELTQLFSLISKFQPGPLELQPHCKPFLPALVPSIGAIDAFIKVPRPDGEQDPLGLSLLDEPTIGCSNPQILRMQLREKFGVVGCNEGDGYIGFIDTPSRNQKALASFLESFDEIQRNRAAPTMAYSYKMPDLEDLMQVWPEEMDGALASLPLPTADMDMTLEEYTKVICAMLDIPVKGNIVESLHVLFSLFQMFKDIGYFAGASRGSTPKS